MEEERKTKRQLKISCPGSPAAGRPAYIYIVKGARTDLVCPTLFNRMAAVQIVLTSLRLQMSLPRLFMTHDRGKKTKRKKTLSSAASAAEGGSVNALRMEKRGAKSLITRKRSNGCKETDPVHQLTGVKSWWLRWQREAALFCWTVLDHEAFLLQNRPLRLGLICLKSIHCVIFLSSSNA